jgi:hypothetical protein
LKTTSFFASHGIRPLRIMCIAWYSAIVFGAPADGFETTGRRDSLLDESVVLFGDSRQRHRFWQFA